MDEVAARLQAIVERDGPQAVALFRGTAAFHNSSAFRMHGAFMRALGSQSVYTTLTIPGVMLLEAFLSFLGLGVQPPMSSWGVLIKDGAEKMEEFPWLLIFPGTMFSLTLFSLNFLGDGLRDALDPRIRGR